MESDYMKLLLAPRKHGDGGNTEDGGGPGGGGSSSGGGGGPGPGSQTPSPTSSPPQTTTVTTISTSTRTFVSVSTEPAQGNNGPSSSGPTPTPEPVRAPPSTPQSSPQAVSSNLKVAPTTAVNQDNSSPTTSPAPGSAPSGGSAPPSSSSSVVFVLNNPVNTTVCDSLLLSWSYVGQSPIPLTLAVQAQTSPFGVVTSPQSPSQPRILSTNISSSAANYHWNPVDVKEGWYNAHAYDTANTTGITASSSPFFVAQGSDTTCLLALGPTSTSAPNPLQPSDSTRIPIGDIIGIALGVTAGVLGLITALILPRMRKHSQDSKPLLDSPKTITRKKVPRLLY